MSANRRFVGDGGCVVFAEGVAPASHLIQPVLAALVALVSEQVRPQVVDRDVVARHAQVHRLVAHVFDAHLPGEEVVARVADLADQLVGLVATDDGLQLCVGEG
jgi:hypothetical protein